MSKDKHISILGIESSCDETAASVVVDGRLVYSNVIASQIETHKKFGGVVPEIASRCHVGAIVHVIQTALANANLTPTDIDGIAVTAGPGLVGALLVGLSAAKGLSIAWEKPLYPVHHIAGHIAANYLVDEHLKPPFICLVVSGGHSHIVHVSDPITFEILGSTRDDAAGEAYDKVARALGLGYPGGPAIDRAAQQGDPSQIVFPKTRFKDAPLDFSFSGVKTACLNYLNQMEQYAKRMKIERSQLVNVNHVAAGFQEAVTSVLADHLLEAAANYPDEPICLAGGVACNQTLRAKIESGAKQMGRSFCCPPPSLCTDNAAMIAAMGYQMMAAGLSPAHHSVDAVASLPIDAWQQAFGYSI